MEEQNYLQDTLFTKRQYTAIRAAQQFWHCTLLCMYEDEKQEGQQPQTAFLQP